MEQSEVERGGKAEEVEFVEGNDNDNDLTYSVAVRR
jgi:hypothetical protein